MLDYYSMPSKILFVLTSAGKNLLGGPTGWYLPEAAHPYYILAPHFTIDFASPAGPNPPVDEGSVKQFPDDVKFLEDAKQLLASAKKLSDVKVDDYAAIFYVGGHGPVLDLPFDANNTKVASEFYRKGKIVSAVCHGTAALEKVTSADGKSIFVGKRFTGFSNAEEELTGLAKSIPFLLEDKISELGGVYEKSSELWGPHVVVDGQLFTGQNPASAAPLAKEILKALQK